MINEGAVSPPDLQPAAVPSTPPARRTIPTLRVLLLITLALSLLTPPAAFAWYARDAASVASAGTALPAPSPTSTPPTPEQRMGETILGRLGAQSEALLRGDAAGFLAPVDPANTALRDTLNRRFTSLRAMQVTMWTHKLIGLPSLANGQWSVTTLVSYCYVVPQCRQMTLETETRWSSSGDVTWLVAADATPADNYGPRPWEVSQLRAVAGNRVVVAATARHAARLPAVLAAAERAAVAADRITRWTGPPTRYVVYLAAADEWPTWHGLSQPAWADAYAIGLDNASTMEVVVNTARISRIDMADLLRHEFAHVATLTGVIYDHPQTWWLVEGIAEYIRALGTPYSTARARRYVRSGRWSGQVTLDRPAQDASTVDVNAYYEIAYLGVRRLVDRFGEDKMLSFFGAVVRDGATLDAAALAVFGVAFNDVAADCAQYVRSRTR